MIITYNDNRYDNYLLFLKIIRKNYTKIIEIHAFIIKIP